jgi:centrosomal protein CEP19
MRGVPVPESLAKLHHEFQIDPAEDLNKLSDKELKHRKAIMDLSFEKNRLDRDHPDFVYDKQVDFTGELINWNNICSFKNTIYIFCNFDCRS